MNYEDGEQPYDCPMCESKAISSKKMEFEDTFTPRDFDCMDCNFEWNEIYTFESWSKK